MSLVTYTRRDSVAVLTLNDPARRNVLSVNLCAALQQAIATAHDDTVVKAIVVTGEGSAFCAGADLADLEAAAAGETAAVNQVYAAFMAIAQSPLPTCAAVNGPAVGAGLNLALACDMRIAGPAARFDTRFLKLGLHPGGGCSWMLLRAVGWAQASRMLLAGCAMDAHEAQRIGLAEMTQAPLIDTTLAQLQPLLTVPRELVMRTKATLRLAATSDHAAAIAHETTEQLWSLRAPGFAESIARLKAGR